MISGARDITSGVYCTTSPVVLVPNLKILQLNYHVLQGKKAPSLRIIEICEDQTNRHSKGMRGKRIRKDSSLSASGSFVAVSSLQHQ